MKKISRLPIFCIHLAVLCTNFPLLTLNFDFGDFPATFEFFCLIGFPYNRLMAVTLTPGNAWRKRISTKNPLCL